MFSEAPRSEEQQTALIDALQEWKSKKFQEIVGKLMPAFCCCYLVRYNQSVMHYLVSKMLSLIALRSSAVSAPLCKSTVRSLHHPLQYHSSMSMHTTCQKLMAETLRPPVLWHACKLVNTAYLASTFACRGLVLS